MFPLSFTQALTKYHVSSTSNWQAHLFRSLGEPLDRTKTEAGGHELEEKAGSGAHATTQLNKSPHYYYYTINALESTTTGTLVKA